MSKTVKKLKSSLEGLRAFVSDDQWYDSLRFDMSLNSDLEDYIVDHIKKLSTTRLSGSEINDFLQGVRDIAISTLEEAEEKGSKTEHWRTIRKAYALYGFLETIIEASVFSESLTDKLASKLGDGYLIKMTEIDRINPSRLTHFAFRSETNKGYFHLPEVSDYLILKKWQDDQHIFHDDFLFPRFTRARDAFESWFRDEYPYLTEAEGRDLLALAMIADQVVVDVSFIAKAILGGITSAGMLVGGKTVGLAVLDTTSVNIPETKIIPVSSIKSKSYMEAIKNLPSRKWAVRSSATVEDGDKCSFAGLFESFLDVPNTKVEEALEDVVSSTHTSRVNAYVNRFNTRKPEMAVILQDFRSPKFSGVWIGKSMDSGHLEWIDGTGEDLVSGRVKPNHEEWVMEFSESPVKAGKEAIGKVMIMFQKELQTVSDFEWCVIDNKVICLQFRPVTREIKTPKEKQNVSSSDFLKGTAASAGVETAKAVVLHDPDETSEWEKGSILITQFTDPDWVPVMIDASAVVTVEGGFLSHAAIIARELGIPCVTGVQDALMIKTGDTVTVNGDAGTVEINK